MNTPYSNNYTKLYVIVEVVFYIRIMGIKITKKISTKKILI